MSPTPDPLLPAQKPFRIRQTAGTPGARELERIEHLLVAVPEKPAAAVWKQFPEGVRIRNLRSKRRARGVVTSRLHNAAGTGISVGSVPGTSAGARLPDAFALLHAAGKLVASARTDRPASVAVCVAGFADDMAERIVHAIVLALRAHAWDAPAYKAKAHPPARLRSVTIYGLQRRIDLRRTLAEGDALNLARWLTALPPNKLDMPGYRRAVEALGKQRGWDCEFLDTQKLTRLGAGAFLAVAQGNGMPGAGILHIRYRPGGTRKSTRPLVSLVGKGIISQHWTR